MYDRMSGRWVEAPQNWYANEGEMDPDDFEEDATADDQMLEDLLKDEDEDGDEAEDGDEG